MELSGCRVRGPPGLPSCSSWRLQPRRDPPGASPRGAHSGRVAAAGLEPGRRHGVQASGSSARVGGVSLPLLPSRKARRGHEDWQCAQGTGQQRQRPAALSLPSSELGPHGSGRAVRALPSAGRAANLPGARWRPGHGRESGAPPPRSREPAGLPVAAAAAAAGRGSRRAARPGSPCASPAAPRSHARGAALARLSLCPGRHSPREVRTAGSLPRKFQPSWLRKKPSPAAALTLPSARHPASSDSTGCRAARRSY